MGFLASTAERLFQIERLQSFQNFCDDLLHNTYDSLNPSQEEALRLLFEALLEKNLDSRSEISKAAYSALMIYRQEDSYRLYAGANIDPQKPEYFKNPEYRNCAEKQTAQAAARDGLSNKNLIAIFLYRRQSEDSDLNVEKLLPCLDCTRNYLYDLLSNQGKLILLLPNEHKRQFFIQTNLDLDTNHIQAIALRERLMYYKIFKPYELNFLRIEKQLGARVSNLEGSVSSPEV